MIRRMYVFAQIGILSLSFLIGLNARAQEKPSSVVEDFKPATTNQMGSEYPQVNSVLSWNRFTQKRIKMNRNSKTIPERDNLKVVMCTPSATPPARMRVDYPETFIMDGHYIRVENGTRGLESIVNSKYRMFVEKIVTEMAKHYGKKENVVGWQIDSGKYY